MIHEIQVLVIPRALKRDGGPFTLSLCVSLLNSHVNMYQASWALLAELHRLF